MNEQQIPLSDATPQHKSVGTPGSDRRMKARGSSEILADPFAFAEWQAQVTRLREKSVPSSSQ